MPDEVNVSSSLPIRPRRLRKTQAIRQMVQETHVTPNDLIAPLFVREGKDIRRAISTLPGQFQWSIDQLLPEIREIRALGIPAVILFGIPDHKDGAGSENTNPDGIIPRAIRAIKNMAPELIIISDMCFCEYTDHGHCGIINQQGSKHYIPQLPEGYLLNDPTLQLLGQASVVHADAGADIIAPSGMIDGMVGAIRAALDNSGHAQTAIMSYAVKYASAFYGPFREAAESAPSFGDRHQYQMNPANRREALHEAKLDIQQGSDMIMVKPALPYLDIVREIRNLSDLPLAAYQVSGEYAMLHAAAEKGWLDLERSVMEALIGIKRAGADLILTYFAKDVCKWLN